MSETTHLPGCTYNGDVREPRSHCPHAGQMNPDTRLPADCTKISTKCGRALPNRPFRPNGATRIMPIDTRRDHNTSQTHWQSGTHLTLILILIVVLGLLLNTGSINAQSTAPSPVHTNYDPDTLLAIAPEQRDEVAASLISGLTTYDIALTFPETEASRELKGTQHIVYTNTTDEPLDTLPFRLYANSVADGNDAVTIEQVAVDGQNATVDLTVGNSVATVELPDSLLPGDTIDIDMDFATTPGQDDPRHYGIFNFTNETRTWSLAHWYPVIAGRDPVTGWMLEPTSVYGDPIFTETAFYTVEITAPKDMQFITSGVETDISSSDGMTNTTFNAWPSRDFVVIADADMESRSTKVGNTTVTSWYESGTGDAGALVLNWTTQALELFNELLGEYPYREFNVVSTEIYNAAGVEFPQLVTIDRGYYGAESPSTHFEFTVAHEVVHQWLFSLVGNNQYAHAFIDESLTNYLSSAVYFERFHDEEQAAALMQRTLIDPFENAVSSNTDPIVDFPTDAFPTQGGYVVAVYSKGPLGFTAIHDAMGDDAFFSALQNYVAEFSFRIATPANLLNVFEHATTIAIEPIWTHWFEERQGALDTDR